jgi:hypothetical protein
MLANQVLYLVCGHHDHFGAGPDFLDLFIGFHPVHEGHLDIHENNVERIFFCNFYGLRPVFSDGHGAALALQDERHRLTLAEGQVFYFLD